MSLTKEQLVAVEAKGSAYIDACPGSGKTRVVVARLLRELERVRASPRKVACITYTNVAVDEIERRLGMLSSSEDRARLQVSTIHGFCLTNILRRFPHHIPGYGPSFRVVGPQDSGYQDAARRALKAHGLSGGAARFRYVGRGTDGRPSIDRSAGLTPAVVEAFWGHLREQGAIDFPSIVYFSAWILAMNPRIVRLLGARFASIVVDEFQDTSDLQVEILTRVAHESMTTFFLVGDKNQSIYGFQGARPKLMAQFAAAVGCQTNYPLSKNFRSTEAIIDDAERICPRSPRMRGKQSKLPVLPVSWVCADTAGAAVVDHFLPRVQKAGIAYADTAILASTAGPLKAVAKRIRGAGLTAAGGAVRPYAVYNHFTLICESVCGYASSRHPEGLGPMRRAVTRMLEEGGALAGSTWPRTQSMVCVALADAAVNLSLSHPGALEWCHGFSEVAWKILQNHGLVLPNQSNLLEPGRRELHAHLQNRPGITTSEMGWFAAPADRGRLNLLTIHGAKGSEFDAVAIIDLHEGRLPHRSARTLHDRDEERRKLYVAVTRARRLLMYVFDVSDSRNQPSSFLDFLSDRPGVQLGARRDGAAR